MLAFLSRILTLGLAVYSYWQIKASLPENLPGSPATIAARVLFGIQLLTSAVFFLIPYFPEAVHFGSRRLEDYTFKQLERVTPLLQDMMGLMGLLMALFFFVNIYLLTVQAHSLAPRESARALISVEPWLIGGLLVGQAITTFYYLRRFDSATESGTDSESIGD